MKANAMIKRLLMKKAPHTLRTSGCIKILAFKGMNQRVCRRFNRRRNPKGKSLPQNRKSKTVSSPASGLSLSISLRGLNAVALSKTFSAIRKRNTTISSWRLPVPSTTLELIAGGLKNLFAIMSNKGFPVFVAPVREGFGASNAAVALIFSLARAQSGPTGLLAGWFIDRFGPRRAVLLGALLSGGGFLALGYTTSLWAF